MQNTLVVNIHFVHVFVAWPDIRINVKDLKIHLQVIDVNPIYVNPPTTASQSSKSRLT